MTVCLETKIQKFNGLSTDAKPTVAPEGSIFHNLDTGEEYIYHNSAWELDLRLINAIRIASI